MSKELKAARKAALRVADELGYPKEIRKRIKETATEIQITNVLAEARRAM